MNKYKGTVKKYDQSFSGVNTKKTRAGSVEFKVTSHLSVKQLKEAYGKGLRAFTNKQKALKRMLIAQEINTMVYHSLLRIIK